MRYARILPLLAAILFVSACQRGADTPAPAEPDPTQSTAPAATPDPEPAEDTAPAQTEAPPTPAVEFDTASVPITDVALPPFPFFDAPTGLTSIHSDKMKRIGYDRQYFIAGNKAVPIEGTIFRDAFPLRGEDRMYSELEFHKNYENAILALGGRRISETQYTKKVTDAAGGIEEVEKHQYGATAVPNYEHNTYLIRTADKEYWIEVSTGSVPVHGYVVVLERKGMEQSVAFLDASAMKQAIDASGRVALYINFDVDKATLRPDAQPVVQEIEKLMSADPGLKLSIEGHTDNTGTEAHNATLSAARARSVLGALVGLGIDPARLRSEGFGQSKPVADNDSEAGRAKNRRVELVKL